MRLFQQGMALFLSWCLLLMGVRDGFAYQIDASNSQPPSGCATESRPTAATRSAYRALS